VQGGFKEMRQQNGRFGPPERGMTHQNIFKGSSYSALEG
jgi:hypothetical protein